MIIDKDLGWKRIKRKVAFLDGKEIKAGVLSSAGTEQNGIPIAQVAKWNEYGTPSTPKRPWSVPARPFMAISCDEHKGWKTETDKGVDRIYGGSEVMSQLNGIGQVMKKDIKDIIGQREKFKPLAQSTIRKKGHDIPLIDSGAMLDSIDFEVK